MHKFIIAKISNTSLLIDHSTHNLVSLIDLFNQQICFSNASIALQLYA